MKLSVFLAIVAVVVNADIEAYLDGGHVLARNSSVDGDDSLLAASTTLGDFSAESLKQINFNAPFEVQGCGGVCQNTANKCSSGYKSGLCPGPSNIKCCPMSTGSCAGQCQDTSLSCGTGYQTGKCPGPNNVKCCPTSGGGGGGGGGGSSGPGCGGCDAQRNGLYTAAMAVYNNRASEHYTQSSSRWSGITGHVMPPSAPPYSDCSSCVTWMYWTVFGKGPDFINGANWGSGYTGTLSAHGWSVPCSSMIVGDMCFYGSPISHVTMSIGAGKVVSHGSDPAGIYAYNYRSDVNSCRRYF